MPGAGVCLITDAEARRTSIRACVNELAQKTHTIKDIEQALAFFIKHCPGKRTDHPYPPEVLDSLLERMREYGMKQIAKDDPGLSPDEYSLLFAATSHLALVAH